MIRSMIEVHPEFATLIKNDPIALLEVIKTLMHDSVWSHYPLISMTNAFVLLVNIKQM